MKKIEEFSLTRIHLHENFEFLRKVCEKGDACLPTTGDLNAADLPESTTTLLTASLDKLKTKTDAFDAVLKIADSIPASTLAAQADAKRDKAYRDGRRFVTVMADHPNPDLASTAKAVLFLYDKYGDPTNKSQDEESSSLYNLMQDLDALEEGVLESIHFTEWYAYLKDCQDEFLAADKQRTEEKMAKETNGQGNGCYQDRTDRSQPGLPRTGGCGECACPCQWRNAVCRVYRLCERPDCRQKGHCEIPFHQKCQ